MDFQAIDTAKTRPLAGAGVATMVVAVLLLFALAEAAIVLPAAFRQPFGTTVGMDFGIYMDRTRAWLTGEGFYLPYQLAGPYTVGTVSPPPALYPPVLLYLTVPFTILPAVLWWVIPLSIIGWSARHTSPWQWVVLAAVLVYPRTWVVLVYGNPSLWAFAFLAVRWGPLVALKPTLGPFALVGIRHRSWWLWAAAGIMLALPLGMLWLEYATAIRNADNGFGLDYLLGEWPIALALVLATSRPVRPASA